MAEPVIPNPIKSSQIETGLTPKAAAKPKQKSQPSQISSTQIIQQSLKKEAPETDPNRFMSTLAAMMQRKVIQLVQIGNTVFLLKPMPNGVVEFHTFTIEPPENLVKRYQAGINTVKQMGYKKAISYAQSPAFVKIAQQTGLPVHVSQSQTMMGNKMVPAYKFEVDL
jgi:hypothetical protein